MKTLQATSEKSICLKNSPKGSLSQVFFPLACLKSPQNLPQALEVFFPPRLTRPPLFFLFLLLSYPPVCVFLRKPLPALLFTRQRARRFPTTSMVRHFPASPCSSSPMSGRGPPHLPRVLPAASDEEAPFQCYYIYIKKKKPKSPALERGSTEGHDPTREEG